MDFNNTSIKRRQAGMTMVEMMVALGVGSLLLAVLAMMVVQTARSYSALANYVELDVYSRQALDRMSMEIRQADRLTSFSATELVFLYKTQTLRYTYSPSTKQLTRTLGTQTSVLLAECDQLTFSVFQRTPISGTFDQFTATTPGTAKLIRLNWICSRKILGASVNTESVQSAKFVMRGATKT